MEVKASIFLTREQQLQIHDAIKEAEGETSGEIRVHVETSLTGNVLDRAAWIFKRIGMHATDDRNGVLFYLAVKNKEFAIIGDGGINAKVPENFWDKTKVIVQKYFRQEKYAEGLIEGILMAGSQLKEHFPLKKDDTNELPDEISFDDTEQPEKL
jgi:uncharacterized membrane protein